MTHKKNILYILNHKTLTDFELPLLINKGYGVLIAKNLSSLNIKYNSLYNNSFYYDNFINLDIDIISKMNNVDWYKENIISDEIIDILNNYFGCVFLTILTPNYIIEQLINKYSGKIYYRFFGRENNLRYNNLVPIKDEKIKYIFSYQEIYNFETSFDNFFNENNSLVIPLGLSNSLINKIKNTYNPKLDRICFVLSKIGICGYYTNIYNEFKKNFQEYEHIILGKHNVIKDNQIINNLDDDDYYNQIVNSKLLFYHGTEPRHLHYHPIEAIIIGIPIIFFEKSLLSKYIDTSPGKCSNVEEAKIKIRRILKNEEDFIKSIIDTQNKSINYFTIQTNKDIFNDLFKNM